jgi:phospholipid/cholesterol/gamma-HCH transport system substrate-binding protein
MGPREREIILGAIVFAAAAIAVIGSMWLSERFAGAAGGYKLLVSFDSVAGLNRGDAVTIRGVKVGKVLSVDMEDGQPTVTIGFAKIRSLPVDSRVEIKGVGLLGEQMVEVQVGSDPRSFQDGDRLTGISYAGLEALTSDAANIAERLDEAVSVLIKERNIAHLENILSQLDSTSASFQDILSESRPKLVDAMDSLAAASSDARGLVGENRDRVRESAENLRVATERLAAMAKEMQSSSGSLREITDNLKVITGKISEGEGTLGRLVHDKSLYDDLRSASVSLDSLLQDIKRDPSRYFKVSVF